jgi:class 3 adenylate cyclase
MEGRLAAILACDVVGYSRTMRVDETGTLERLKACRRRLIDPRLARYCGRVIKLMGDCALVGFASAVDSVSFAVSMQHAMAEWNIIPELHRSAARFRHSPPPANIGTRRPIWHAFPFSMKMTQPSTRRSAKHCSKQAVRGAAW